MNENWIQVITGPMFSGKTTELLSFIERYSYAGINALGIMNELDTRSNDDFIHSRNGHKLKAIKVKKSIDILDYIIKNELKNKIQIIAIDEVQFFDCEIVDVIKKLAKMKFIVICCRGRRAR